MMICGFHNRYYRSDYDNAECQDTNYDTAGGRMLNWRSSYSGRSSRYRKAPMKQPFFFRTPLQINAPESCMKTT